MKYETILVSVENEVVTITLNRPKILNVLSQQVMTELETALDELYRADIRLLLVRGAGDKAFAAGADIKEFVGREPEAAASLSAMGNRVLLKLSRFPAPTIAVIQGFALGGGMEIMLACDLRIGTPNAKMGLPEVGLGIMPGYGGTQRLARLIGPGRAKELVFTGKNIDAETAFNMGILNQVAPEEELESVLKEWTVKLLANAPIGQATAKRVMDQGLETTLEEGLKLEAAGFGKLFGTEDETEGVNAFIERRKPHFTNK